MRKEILSHIPQEDAQRAFLDSAELQKITIPETGLRRYQQYEWEPHSPFTGGFARTLSEATSSVLTNKQLREEHISLYMNREIPRLEQIGVDGQEIRKFFSLLERLAHENKSLQINTDSDTDGTVSGVILRRLALDAGVKQVRLVAPSREDYGYGFTIRDAEEAGGKYDAIFIIDKGIANKEEIDAARSLGSEVAVIDHHRIMHEESVPTDAIVLHSGETTASGLAYLLGREFELRYGTPMSEDFSDLMAIAIRSDVWDMNATSRTLVKHGLETMRRTQRKSLLAIAEVLKKQVSDTTVDSLDAEYGQVLNVWGRYGQPEKTLKLLLAHEPQVLHYYARQMGVTVTNAADERNFRYQFLMQQAREAVAKRAELKEISTPIVNEINADAAQHPDRKGNFYVVSHKDFPVGGINTIVPRVQWNNGKPTAIGVQHFSERFGRDVITFEGRTPNGLLDYTEYLAALEEKGIKLSGGGHEFAVGFTIAPESLAEAERLFEGSIPGSDSIISADVKRYDCEVPLHLVPSLYDWQQKLEPLGKRHTKPVYVTRNTTVTKKQVLKGNHLKLSFTQEGMDSASLEGILFSATQDQLGIEPGTLLDIQYSTDLNIFGGKRTIQLKLADIREGTGRTQSRMHTMRIGRDNAVSLQRSQTEYIAVPEEIKERLLNGVKHVGFDMDDTLKIPDPVTTALRYSCMEAYKHTGDEYFREMYAKVHKKDGSWEKLEKRLSDVSQEIYDDPDYIIEGGKAYTLGWRTADERGDIYKQRLQFETNEEVWEFQRKQFIRGKKFLQRRVDEFTYPAPGAVSFLNFLSEEVGAELSLISDSEANEMLEFENFLRREGFQGKFEHIISAGSLRRRKPDPYSLRNLFSHLDQKDISSLIYIGNTTGDVLFSANGANVQDYPSVHDVDVEKFDVVPVLITRGADYSEYLDLPLHAQFGTLGNMEHYLRQELQLPTKNSEQVIFSRPVARTRNDRPSKILEMVKAREMGSATPIGDPQEY